MLPPAPFFPISAFSVLTWQSLLLTRHTLSSSSYNASPLLWPWFQQPIMLSWLSEPPNAFVPSCPSRYSLLLNNALPPYTMLIVPHFLSLNKRTLWLEEKKIQFKFFLLIIFFRSTIYYTGTMIVCAYRRNYVQSINTLTFFMQLSNTKDY